MAGLSLLSAAPGRLSASFCNSAGWTYGNTSVPTRSTSSARLPVVSMAAASDPPASPELPRRQVALGILAANVFHGSANLFVKEAEAVSSSRRAYQHLILIGDAGLGKVLMCFGGIEQDHVLQSEQIPASEYTSLPSGLKYYDLKVGGGPIAQKGSRVAVHYVAKWKGITFMTSRQGMGVTGGSPYGFDIGASEAGIVLKGLDQGVAGMRVGGQRLLIVPPELAYGKKGVQEIPPNATIEFNVELLSIKQDAYGSRVKVVEG